MRQYFIDKKSDKLLLFFAGWGCDEYEFEHLESASDVLILYNYTDLELDFDFSKYREVNLISFSAGVFVASVFNFDFKVNKKIALDGNPYLFDEKLGLSKAVQKLLTGITEENAEEFARNYLVKTDEEYKNFHPAKRTPESCETEFECLRKIYNSQKQNIKDIYDYAIFGEHDPLFNVSEQKKYYQDRIRLVKNARHNIFFRIKSFEDIYGLCI